jgi:hypothetical protein
MALTTLVFAPMLCYTGLKVDTERDRLIVLVNPIVTHHRGYSPYISFDYYHDRSQHDSGYYTMIQNIHHRQSCLLSIARMPT